MDGTKQSYDLSETTTTNVTPDAYTSCLQHAARLQHVASSGSKQWSALNDAALWQPAINCEIKSEQKTNHKNNHYAGGDKMLDTGENLGLWQTNPALSGIAPSGDEMRWCDACVNRSGVCKSGFQNSCQVRLKRLLSASSSSTPSPSSSNDHYSANYQAYPTSWGAGRLPPLSPLDALVTNAVYGKSHQAARMQQSSEAASTPTASSVHWTATTTCNGRPDSTRAQTAVNGRYSKCSKTYSRLPRWSYRPAGGSSGTGGATTPLDLSRSTELDTTINKPVKRDVYDFDDDEDDVGAHDVPLKRRSGSFGIGSRVNDVTSPLNRSSASTPSPSIQHSSSFSPDISTNSGVNVSIPTTSKPNESFLSTQLSTFAASGSRSAVPHEHVSRATIGNNLSESSSSNAVVGSLPPDVATGTVTGSRSTPFDTVQPDTTVLFSSSLASSTTALVKTTPSSTESLPPTVNHLSARTVPPSTSATRDDSVAAVTSVSSSPFPATLPSSVYYPFASSLHSVTSHLGSTDDAPSMSKIPFPHSAAHPSAINHPFATNPVFNSAMNPFFSNGFTSFANALHHSASATASPAMTHIPPFLAPYFPDHMAHLSGMFPRTAASDRQTHTPAASYATIAGLDGLTSTTGTKVSSQLQGSSSSNVDEASSKRDMYDLPSVNNSGLARQSTTTSHTGVYGMTSTSINTSVQGQTSATNSFGLQGLLSTTRSTGMYGLSSTTDSTSKYSPPSTGSSLGLHGLPNRSNGSGMPGLPSTARTTGLQDLPSTSSATGLHNLPSTTNVLHLDGLKRATNSVGMYGLPGTNSDLGFQDLRGTTNTVGIYGLPRTNSGSELYSSESSASSNTGQPNTTNSTSLTSTISATNMYGLPSTTNSTSMYDLPSTTNSTSMYDLPSTTNSTSMYGLPSTTSSTSMYDLPSTTNSISMCGLPSKTNSTTVYGLTNTTNSASMYSLPGTTNSSSMYGLPGTTNSTSMYGLPSTTNSAGLHGLPSTTNSTSMYDLPRATNSNGLPGITITAGMYGLPSTHSAGMYGLPSTTACTALTHTVYSSGLDSLASLASSSGLPSTLCSVNSTGHAACNDAMPSSACNDTATIPSCSVVGDDGRPVRLSPKSHDEVLSMLDADELKLLQRLKTNQLEEVPQCGCEGVGQYDESRDGPYYTHLGAAPTVAAIRTMMEKRLDVYGAALRIEKVIFTGREGKNEQGCPIAKWIIRRSGPDEKVMCVVRPRRGHYCPTAVMLIGVVIWDGVPPERADVLYDYVRHVVPSYGHETERRCGTNEPKTCACQGWDSKVGGASFSFGCSWSMYYNGCKFAKSMQPRKFRLKQEEEEPVLDGQMQELASLISRCHMRALPVSFLNMTEFENEALGCRLGNEPGRPYAGVTAVVDFCTHSHKDQQNMNNGCTTVVTLTKHRGYSKPDDEQLHVLPLYALDSTDEHGSEKGQREKMEKGMLQCLNKYPMMMRIRPYPFIPKKKRRCGAGAGRGRGRMPGRPPKWRGQRPVTGLSRGARVVVGLAGRSIRPAARARRYKLTHDGRVIWLGAGRRRMTPVASHMTESQWKGVMEGQVPITKLENQPYPVRPTPRPVVGDGAYEQAQLATVKSEMSANQPIQPRPVTADHVDGSVAPELNGWYARWANSMSVCKKEPSVDTDAYHRQYLLQQQQQHEQQLQQQRKQLYEQQHQRAASVDGGWGKSVSKVGAASPFTSPPSYSQAVTMLTRQPSDPYAQSAQQTLGTYLGQVGAGSTQAECKSLSAGYTGSSSNHWSDKVTAQHAMSQWPNGHATAQEANHDSWVALQQQLQQQQQFKQRKQEESQQQQQQHQQQTETHQQLTQKIQQQQQQQQAQRQQPSPHYQQQQTQQNQQLSPRYQQQLSPRYQQQLHAQQKQSPQFQQAQQTPQQSYQQHPMQLHQQQLQQQQTREQSQQSHQGMSHNTQQGHQDHLVEQQNQQALVSPHQLPGHYTPALTSPVQRQASSQHDDPKMLSPTARSHVEHMHAATHQLPEDLRDVTLSKTMVPWDKLLQQHQLHVKEEPQQSRVDHHQLQQRQYLQQKQQKQQLQQQQEQRQLQQQQEQRQQMQQQQEQRKQLQQKQEQMQQLQQKQEQRQQLQQQQDQMQQLQQQQQEQRQLQQQQEQRQQLQQQQEQRQQLQQQQEHRQQLQQQQEQRQQLQQQQDQRQLQQQQEQMQQLQQEQEQMQQLQQQQEQRQQLQQQQEQREQEQRQQLQQQQEQRQQLQHQQQLNVHGQNMDKHHKHQQLENLRQQQQQQQFLQKQHLHEQQKQQQQLQLQQQQLKAQQEQQKLQLPSCDQAGRWTSSTPTSSQAPAKCWQPEAHHSPPEDRPVSRVLSTPDTSTANAANPFELWSVSSKQSSGTKVYTGQEPWMAKFSAPIYPSQQYAIADPSHSPQLSYPRHLPNGAPSNFPFNAHASTSVRPPIDRSLSINVGSSENAMASGAHDVRSWGCEVPNTPSTMTMPCQSQQQQQVQQMEREKWKSLHLLSDAVQMRSTENKVAPHGHLPTSHLSPPVQSPGGLNHWKNAFAFPSPRMSPQQIPLKVKEEAKVEEKRNIEVPTDSKQNFLESEIGGVAIALSHGSVLFEVAKRELHATTAMKYPNRYHPTRISLVFYQHKNLNLCDHGHREFEKKLEFWKERREQRQAAEAEVMEKERREEEEARIRTERWTAHAAQQQQQFLPPPPPRIAEYHWLWQAAAQYGASTMTTSTLSTKWIKPRDAITGPYHRWH